MKRGDLIKKIIKWGLLIIIPFVVIVLLFTRERIIDDKYFFEYGLYGFEKIDVVMSPKNPKLNEVFEIRVRAIPSLKPLIKPSKGIRIGISYIPDSIKYIGGSHPKYEILPHSGPYTQIMWEIPLDLNNFNGVKSFIYIAEFRVIKTGKIKLFIGVGAVGRIDQVQKSYVMEIPGDLNESKEQKDNEGL
jgi:hypothetical protein